MLQDVTVVQWRMLCTKRLLSSVVSCTYSKCTKGDKMHHVNSLEFFENKRRYILNQRHIS